jgi:carboxymethylenebutenolidase
MSALDIRTQRVEIDTPDGRFGAYLARPVAGGPAPGIVVLHEIFGINADLRQTCDTLAAAGFVALCPDLFWHQEPGVEMSDASQADWQKGFALYTAFDRDRGIQDIAASMDWLRRQPGAAAKVGVMGYCLGGLMTFLTAARHGADAAVAYYGAETEAYVDEGRTMATPLLMHLADEDEYMPKEAQARIKATLAGNPQAQVHGYPGCSHAFARHRGAHYDAAAATLADGRTLDFLRRRLA